MTEKDVIDFFMEDESGDWINATNLSEKLGMKARSVSKQLANLRDVKWLESKGMIFNKGKTVLYRLRDLPKPTSLEV